MSSCCHAFMVKKKMKNYFGNPESEYRDGKKKYKNFIQ